MVSNNKVICPYCQTAIRVGEENILCSACKMPHHRECWVENGKCTTYGCKGQMKPNPRIAAYRRQTLPPIEITFAETEEKSFKKLFFRYQWVFILGILFLLGLGYYLNHTYLP